MNRQVSWHAALLAFSGCCTLGLAQGPTVTLPATVAIAKPASATASQSVFYATTSPTASASRTQTLYDTSDIAPSAAVWSALSVRRPHGVGTPNAAFTANATITISQNAAPSGSAVTAFAANHGPSPTVVLSGQIALPARALPVNWPAVWETPFPFTTPYSFAKIQGGSLVVDIQQSANTGGGIWYVEASGLPTGTRTENSGFQPNCRFSTGAFNSGLAHRAPSIGGNWYVKYLNCRPNLAGYGALGANGVGSSWSGVPLPIDLTPYRAPGCVWGVSADLVIPLVTDAAGVAEWPSIDVPNQPWLVGLSFYDHALFLDPPANPWGVVTTWSSAWKVGPSTGIPAATVSATGSAASAPTGTLVKGYAASIQVL